jgi:formyltetrahydrofolate-dependent phosphoribosylglycinamide formyltransferase
MIRVAVLASGGGSNLQALLDRLAALGTTAPATIVLVASNRRGAGALGRAAAAGIPCTVIADPTDGPALAAVLEAARAELIVLAGYLRKIPEVVVERWRGRIVNIHPALLPRHGGAGMYGHHVHAAVLAAGDAESGATVHLVDEVYDRGTILAQARVPVLAGDTAGTLAARVLVAEHSLLPSVVLRAADALARGDSLSSLVT